MDDLGYLRKYEKGERRTGVKSEHFLNLKLPDGTQYAMPVGSRSGHFATMADWFRMKFYDDLSDIRAEAGGYYKHCVHNFVCQFFSEEKIRGKKILDFGCGPGFYSAIFAQRGAAVTGIEMSPFLIEKALEHKGRLGLTNIDFIQAEFLEYSSQMAPSEFDYVVAIDTLVSFDFGRQTHDHQRIAKAFAGIKKVLKDDGTCLIIEAHPFFAHVLQEIPSDTGELFSLRSPHYRIEHKLKGEMHHWFTLEEMTTATSENGLAIWRIWEPAPSPELKEENAAEYAFRLRNPSMIVYEVRKINGHEDG